ncbi:MAG: radical SAM protein [Thermoplasmata archaeon]|nr:radical SAM protein [Thermoplasmata archaeon]
MEEGLTKKAELIHGGCVRLPEGYELPCRVSMSSSGPDAGLHVAVFSFGGFRVRKAVSRTEGEFELRVSESGGLSMYRDGAEFLESVEVQPIIRHCPEQAFFNMDTRSIHRSALHPRKADEGRRIGAGDVMRMLEESMAEFKVRSVAFTTGIHGSVDESVDNVAEAVAAVRAAFPKMTIGVECYIDDPDQIARLRQAGTNEIKINVECARPDIYERVHPDTSYETAFSMLREANAYFKKGKMASNVIYGLGETDQDVDMVLERLCRMNVLPVLRMARVNDLNRSSMEAAGVPLEPPTIIRTLFLSSLQKSAMKRHGLNPERFHTMCFSCQCCDLVPFTDF